MNTKYDITKDKHYEVLKNFVRLSKDGTVRPPYSEITLNTYITNYNKFRKLNGGNESDEYEWINIPNIKNKKELEDLSKNQMVNYLNATIAICKALDKNTDELSIYRDEFMMKSPSKNDTIFTPKQQENLVLKGDIEMMINKIKKELVLKKDLYKNGTANTTERNLYQLYVILKIYELLPIRNEISNVLVIRSKYYKLLTKEDRENNNYLVINTKKFIFYFNAYKTSETYGERIVEIPNSLKLIIQKWLVIKGDDIPNLFVMREGKGLNNNNLTKLLVRASQKYLGKNVSTVLLRKIFYTDKYSTMKKELIHDAGVAGHSPGMALNAYTE
tara:strand:+ start:2370 stop:3359 length:990 start_codon:yes stop_codon:yes gene_type:complete